MLNIISFQRPLLHWIKLCCHFIMSFLVQNCGVPETVTNGVRMMENTTYGSSVSYFCNPGYMLVGSRKRVCQANGQWSGQATSCASKF